MRRLGRFLLAVLATLVVVGGTYGAWAFGLAHFDDDYCVTNVEIPAGDSTIAAPGWEPPMTYRCDYGAAGEVTVNEPRPMLWTGAMGGVAVLGVSAVWWRLATGSPGPKYEGKHRT